MWLQFSLHNHREIAVKHKEWWRGLRKQELKMSGRKSKLILEKNIYVSSLRIFFS